MIKKKIKFFFIFNFFIIMTACQSVSNKINDSSKKEEIELSKWLNKSETELKINYGQPDKIEFLDSRNRNYVYKSKKFKIECERKFEINPNNIVIGFSSKNCF